LPKGYGPTQFHTAYNLPANSTNPATIAIVDAYNHPSIKADLDTYNSTFGLPSFPSCSASVTTSCFTKVNQRGGTSYPSTNSGWALEIALDVETAHQTCQNCKLILVEADSNSYANLMTAVDEARALGATVISNSYGSSEFSGETAYDSHFNHPGTAFTFSSGDNGYGATYPAASPYVTAVGGTSLSLTSTNTRQAESVWNGAGSGCSAFELKPSFQHDSGCSRRTIADVSADADPNTGAAVYDSVRYQGRKGWFQVGGTSLAAPLIAGVYALAGNLTTLAPANSMPYTSSSNLYDVISGSNGTCGTYLCNGGSGFDGPSGLGSPIGFGAF
jgi:subtilase family serine protease